MTNSPSTLELATLNPVAWGSQSEINPELTLSPLKRLQPQTHTCIQVKVSVRWERHRKGAKKGENPCEFPQKEVDGLGRNWGSCHQTFPLHG